MQFLIDFVDWIVNLCTTVYEFFTDFVENLLMLFEYLGLTAAMCYNLIAGLPAWIQAFGTLTILVSVLYMILGRETGGRKQ